MLTVHLRINDAATGQPTPVRLRVTREDGGYFVPLGQHAEFPTGIGETVGGSLWLARERWCYTNGSSEMLLPASVPLRIQALKGPCFAPLDETVTLKPGQMTLRLEIHRKLDDNGWASGDGRTHFFTPHGAALEGQAEDVRFTNLLALDFAAAALDGQTYHSTPNMEAFSGQADQAVPVNTFNQHPVLGRVSLLFSHRPVHPLVFGAPDVSDDWSLSDWCDQCKRKGGLPVWVAPFETSAGVVGGEGLVALLNGNLSTIELDGQARFQPILPHWYRLLNAGFRVGLVGASGKKSNRLPVGGMRTYVREATTYAEWIHGVREGENFITNGPLVEFTREGQELHATTRSLTAFDTLEILGNGVPIASAKPVEQSGVWTAKLDVTIDKPAIWHAARVGGAKSFLNPEQPAFAHSSPIYSLDPPPFRRSATDVAPWRKALETTLHWIENHGQFTNPKSRDRLLSYVNSAMAKLA